VGRESRPVDAVTGLASALLIHSGRVDRNVASHPAFATPAGRNASRSTTPTEDTVP